MKNKKIYGLGRSRNKKGEWTGLHLNDYTMCIHTLCGGGWATMQVLIVEVEDEKLYDDTEGGQ